MWPSSALSLMLALGLTACSAATAPGSRYHLTGPQQLGGNTVQWLALCNPNPDVGPVTCNALLTGERTDQEAWHFEARLRVVSGVGISYGRSPQDFMVTGTQEHCERVRAAFPGQAARLLRGGDAADRIVQRAAVLQARGREVARLMAAVLSALIAFGAERRLCRAARLIGQGQ